METLIVHPDNKKQLAALKAFKISFEEEKSSYDPEFVAKVLKGREQIKNGESRVINIADL